jgi:hypothetical protein
MSELDIGGDANTAPVLFNVSKLGVRGWNIAYIGGEDSAYPSQDCRVLILRWEGYDEGLPNLVMGRLGVSSSQGNRQYKTLRYK